MQATIRCIRKELAEIYPVSEIRGITRLIFEKVCGIDYVAFLTIKDEQISQSAREEIEKIVARLRNHEPIQYILGETEFCELKIKVNPSVLIPRPETEELVQWVTEMAILDESAILDIGTGSGCIALALKKHFPEAEVCGVDISEKALEMANENAMLNSLDVKFIDADILTWENYNWPKFDVIVSNPPYVRAFEKPAMQQNVVDFEPHQALFVTDDDPLLFYRRICEFVSKHLKKGGWLFFEINESLASETAGLLTTSDFGDIEIKKDINGKDRMIRFKRN